MIIMTMIKVNSMIQHNTNSMTRHSKNMTPHNTNHMMQHKLYNTLLIQLNNTINLINSMSRSKSTPQKNSITKLITMIQLQNMFNQMNRMIMIKQDSTIRNHMTIQTTLTQNSNMKIKIRTNNKLKPWLIISRITMIPIKNNMLMYHLKLVC
uniref:Uncharacterized protein n=1 Tax=Cacopsylla melanoneura TaxID=428564 RepID=A0A8D8QSM8_9HEMI